MSLGYEIIRDLTDFSQVADIAVGPFFDEQAALVAGRPDASTIPKYLSTYRKVHLYVNSELLAEL